MPAPGQRKRDLQERVRLRLGTAAARLWRRRLTGVTFIGVTGSCGKTTTKELIAAGLGSRLRGRSTPAQGNGPAVAAKTLLRTTPRDDFCVLEVAAGRAPGAVREDARVVRPNIAVVTNVGGDHRKMFRSLEATAAEKRALLDGAAAGAIALLNADDPHVLGMAEGFHGRVVTFGGASEADLRAEDISSSWPERLSFTLHAEGRALPIRTKFCGKHWTTSVLAALGVAGLMGVPLETAAEAIAAVEPTPGRMAPAEHNGVTVVWDLVKAPFWSLDTAYEFLAEARAPQKVAVIGTISDYAGSSTSAYRRAAERALAAADEVIFIGAQSRHALKARNAPPGALHAFEEVDDANRHLATSLQEGALVLVKGSEKVDPLYRLALGPSPVRRLALAR